MALPKRNQRCQYCSKTATVGYRYSHYYTRWKSRNHMFVYIAACEDHKTCAGFTGMLSLKPEAERVL